MNDAPEIWKPVVGFEGHYEVSSLGRVRSATTLKVLSPFKSRNGYIVATFSVDRKRKKLSVHRMVCEAFVGPAPSKDHEVRHGDGVRSNNRQDNLVWGTAAENAADRVTHGTQIRGQDVHNSKLTEADVVLIREDRRRLKDIACEYGVHLSLISLIKRRRVWAHV